MQYVVLKTTYWFNTYYNTKEGMSIEKNKNDKLPLALYFAPLTPFSVKNRVLVIK